MSKTCRELFSDIDNTIIGDENEKICGIAYRSDKVKPGDAFFCIVGSTTDGHTFAQDAIDRGARVIVVQRKVYLADASEVTEVIVSDTRKAMACAAAQYYEYPSRFFDLVGITGTSGKTSLTYLLEHIVSVAGKRCGVLGSADMRLPDKEQTEHGVLESPDIQAVFKEMKDNRCDVVAMEISSLALDVERVWGSHFAVSVFSNLSQDHLNYHHTFEAYFEAKARLFSSDYPAKRVIDIDDAWGKELLRRCSSAGDSVITTGFDPNALIHPIEIVYHQARTDIALEVKGTRYDFAYPLPGRNNVDNVMLIFGVGLHLGISPQTIIEALSSAPSIPGRMEYIGIDAGKGTVKEVPAVYIDHMHSSTALTRVIDCVKELTERNVFVVCSCGDISDPGRQSVIAKAALAANHTFFTSTCFDQNDVAPFFETLKVDETNIWENAEVEANRKAAIERAIGNAQAGDSVLIVGIDHGYYRKTPCGSTYLEDKSIVVEQLQQKARANG